MRLQNTQWRRADMFRRIPKDLTEATTTGAIISIICLSVMTLLFLGEVISYVFPRTQSDVVVDPGSGSGEKMKVHIDITFYQLPCALASLDIIDVLHNHVMGSMDNIVRTRLDAKGREVGVFTDSNAPEVVKTEGCRLVGHFFVTKVPGNFHISCHSRPKLAHTNFPNGLIMDHKINHLSFGATNVKKLSSVAQLSPLDGQKAVENHPHLFQYFLDIIPTTYEGTIFSSHTYQFTSQMSTTHSNKNMMAAVFFQYQVSPLSVKYSAGRVSFTHFLTYLCAIVGGVFTVCGLMSRFIQVSSAQIQKRFMGKGD
ncbi:COPII vesicle protein [Strigomonas culicis]|uniref:COPII vesicle protein n=1 Tax=Strigomonas culicis TaxID=28005 RepID=S9V2D6_9TRYP|nr:COPII vesicle protein [Strigomonas culicis]EPY37267.1 COPII vesicle protein [Strigomonas culicis]|eukprot:EPY31860.1 COPII vesicle protein [Strigomonas culicis]